MNEVGSPPTNANMQLQVEGVVSSGGASAHAHHLAKMRVNPKSPPTTPITPTCPTTPAFMNITTTFGEENIMEDLQLAAELGKTLLERNRELESNLKQHQAVIEDQLQEIEYLSKQTAALREVNDSRLRIYEQLEISIQELEKNNQRLSAEGASDKRKIKGLCSNIESLEGRCDELQKNLEEARAGAQQLRGRNKRRSLIMEEQSIRRSHSCENTTQTSEDRATEELETRAKMEELQERLKESQNERMGEVRRREELEIQLACMAQENAVLQDQLTVLREKEVTLRTFDEELASLDDTSSGRLCRKCLGHVDDSASNSGLYDLHDSIEDTDASIESIHGECALVKLKNGGYAWGSQLSQESPATPKSPTEKLSRLTPPRAPSHSSNHSKREDPQSSCSSSENSESLASIGQVVSQSGGTSPGTEVSDAPHNSLLSELDTSYRILIEKYEALLEAREQQQQQGTQNAELNHGELIHPGVDDLSGPMSLVMTDGILNNQANLKCQRCHTCACDLKPNDTRPKSNLEEFSEVETSSSGFSDGESRISNKSTQTGEELLCRDIFEDSTPTPTVPSRCLDLSSPINPCDKRFQAAPEYKKLFQEIFTVLKKTVDEKDGQNQPSKTSKTPLSAEPTAPPVLIEIVQNDIPEKETVSEASVNESKTSLEKENLQEVNTINKAESHSENTATELVLSADSLLHSKPQLITDEGNDSKLKGTEGSEEQRITHKPPRPDSLDLGGNSSRSSSRQRRRRRQHHRVKLENLQQQQQFQGQYQYTHGNQISSHNQGQLGQSSHKHNRRDRDHYHAYHTQRQQGDDFPNLQQQAEGEHSRTRIVYNSSRGKCEHHRSRRHRDRTNNGHSQRYQQQNNHDVNEQSNHNDYQRYQGNETEPREKTTPKINYPSVEVAKLRKLEMTYAEALKTSFSRSYYNRRY